MEPADKLLAAGDLDGARRSLVGTLRTEPRDPAARMLLFQLLCVMGEWEKASAQLRAIAQLDPEAQMLQTAYNQVIAAEQARAAAFAGTAAVTILVEAPDWMSALTRSLEAFGKGNAAEGNELRGQAFDGAPDSAGTLNDRDFTRLADVDARFGPVFEAMIAGRWGLIPFEAVSEIKSEGPRDLCDVVWLPIEITLRSGPGLAGFIPARYPGTELAPESELRLGKRTEWRQGASGEEGLGQRQWFTDKGDEFDILSLRRLKFS